MFFGKKFGEPINKVLLSFCIVMILSISVMFQYGDLMLLRNDYDKDVARLEYHFSIMEQTPDNIEELQKERCILKSDFEAGESIRQIQILVSIIIVVIVAYFTSLNVNFEINRYFSD